MHNVFVEVQLFDGRKMSLEDIVWDYERLLLKEESLKTAITSEPKDDKSITFELKVGEWFRIDREVIDKSKEEIRRKCVEVGIEGRKIWERFVESNEIADNNPDQYPQLIETYIFQHNWEFKTDQQMRDMCDEVGDGMCDEVVCDLELQMRICNGESLEDLIKTVDMLPQERVIKLRSGGKGSFGGGVGYHCLCSPADIWRDMFHPDRKNYNGTPYAFRRVIS